MLLQKLKVNYFGRFQNRELELKPGINLIYGDNEAGKSTLHTFIKGMLFGIERLRGRASASKEDLYIKYLPWDYPGAFGGSMDIRIGDKEYRLQRSFHTTDKSFVIIDLSTGRELKLKEGLISELFPGLTESTFKNTISIEQLKAQTDSELAVQVRNYIANLSTTKSKEVNVAKAVSSLTEQRKQLEPTQNIAVLKQLQAEIEDGMEKEERIDQLTIKLRELLMKEAELTDQKTALSGTLEDETTKRMEQLPAILEKYRSYLEMTKQDKALEEQDKELQGQISDWEKEQHSCADLKEDLLMVDRLWMETSEQDRMDMELQKEKDTLHNKGKKYPLISLLPACLTAILIAIILSFQPMGLAISAGLAMAGFIIYYMLRSSSLKKLQILNAKIDALREQKHSGKCRLNDIYNKYQLSTKEELGAKQELAQKNYYSLEHAKKQWEELKSRKQELEANLDLIYEAIMRYMQYFIPAEELTSDSVHRLQQDILRRKQEASGRLSEINHHSESIKLQIEKIKWEISTLEGNEEQLLKNKEKYSELELKQKENAVELEAIKLALTSIQELSTEIHDSFGQQLNQTVSEVIREVTSQKYSDLKVDEKLEVKVGWNGDYILLDRLSAGTIDQVYFALRLAIADLLLGKDEIPLLLDDSLAFYDEARAKAALKKISDRQQTILFTCHKREQLLLRELGIPYHFIDLSCS